MNQSEVVATTNVRVVSVTGEGFIAILQLHADGTTSWKENHSVRGS